MSNLASSQHMSVSRGESALYQLGMRGHSRALPLFSAKAIPGIMFSTPVGQDQMARTHGSARSRDLQATGKEGVKTLPHARAKHAQGKLSSAKKDIGWLEHEIDELVYEDDGKSQKIRPIIYVAAAIAAYMLLNRE